jgi:hypothetical protein
MGVPDFKLRIFGNELPYLGDRIISDCGQRVIYLYKLEKSRTRMNKDFDDCLS